jgi:hypothetical protein
MAQGDGGARPEVLPGVTPRRAASKSGIDRAARFVILAPDLVAPALAGLSVMAMILVLLGAYLPVLVIPLGLAGAVTVAFAASRVARLDRGALGPTLTAIGIALAFGLASGAWSGEYLDSNLDPGTYANAGLWLTHHASIDVAPRTSAFGLAIQGLQSTAPGWSLFHGHVQAQGNHLLPALLAIGGWIGGTSLLLKTNALLGSAALLALFSLSRRFVPGWWAILPVAAAAVSQPFVAFARAAYTEPVAATLVLGGLALAVPAVRHPTRWGVAIASFVIGAACLVRIDSYVYAVGVIAAGVVAARIRSERRWSLFFASALGWTLPALLGTADLYLLAHTYIHALRVQLTSELTIVIAALGLGLLAVRFSGNAVIARVLTPKVRAASPISVAGAIVAVFAVLASRPLWFVQHGRLAVGFGGLQASLGLQVDATRTYGESTVSWLAWYLGWPAVVLGVLGLALLARRILSVPRPELTAPLVVVLVDAIVYLVRPRIVPFQVWASRRFVPVVIPGLLIGATIAISALYRRAQGAPRHGSAPLFSRTGRLLAIVVAATTVAIPAVVTWPLLRVRDHAHGLSQAETLCRAVGHRAAILLLDGPAEELGPTLRATCASATAWTLSRVTPATLAKTSASASRNGLALYVIASKPSSIPYRKRGPVAPTTAFKFTSWQEEIDRVPHRVKRWQPGYWVGRIATDGYADAAFAAT